MPILSSTKLVTEWRKGLFKASDALMPLPELTYAAKPFFPIPSLSLFYGISGSHKTNLAMDLAVCVALGKPWLVGLDATKQVGYATTPSPILWVDADSGLRTVKERLGACLRAHGGNSKTPIHFASFLQPTFTASNPDCVAAMIALIIANKCKFVVYDNLGTVSGGVEENTSGMIQVMSSLRSIAEQTGSVVIVIHHDAKYAGERKTPRGHTSIEAALNVALWIQRDADVVTCTPTKIRDAPFNEFTALFTYEHFQNSLMLEQMRFFGLEAHESQEDQNVEKCVVAFLKQNSFANQTTLADEIAQECNIGKHKATGHLDRLVAKGVLVCATTQARNASVYTLAKSTKGGKP
jgi:hypothetical protein